MGGLCKAKTREEASAATDENIESGNARGGEFLACKISEHFAVEANANECLHGGVHYQHLRDAIVEWVQDVLERVLVNCLGQGSADALSKWHWCWLNCWLHWWICA